MNAAPPNYKGPYFFGRIVFLVYDSRSGSTMLSHEIAKTLPQVVASPEFRINALIGFSHTELTQLSPHLLLERLTAKRGLANLGLIDEEIVAAFESVQPMLTHDHLLRIILGHYVVKEGRENADVFVIKKGTHLLVWRDIAKLFHDVEFLHVFRDARAVVNSKLSTFRPYYPLERMAWGGPFLAALQWRAYSKAMHKAANRVNVYDVKYEELLNDPDTVLRYIAQCLSVEFQPEASEAYTIPEAEKSIHRRVGSDMDTSRAQAWKSEMSTWSVAVVEELTREEMELRGYDVEPSKSPVALSFALVASGIESFFRLLFHYPYNWYVDHKSEQER